MLDKEPGIIKETEILGGFLFVQLNGLITKKKYRIMLLNVVSVF